MASEKLYSSRAVGWCILGAWNYPFNLSIRPLLAAIAAGNCAVLKPSELAPATSSLLAQLIPQYLDEAIQCFEGDGDFAGELLRHRFDHIFYTGSANIAKKVMAAAAQYLTPVTLELGGKSPCLIDSSADIRITAKRVAWSKWLNAGQTCIAPDYVLVDQKIADRFVAALIHELKAFYGDCAKSSESYGRIINRRHTARLADALADQAVVFGGDVDLSECYISPTIVREPSMQSTLMQHEIFGPILPVISVDDKQQMIDIVNGSEKPLALYSYAKDDNFNREVEANISAGNVCINDGMMFMANQKLPFGGVGEVVWEAMAVTMGSTFSHFKSVMVILSLMWLCVIRRLPQQKLDGWLACVGLVEIRRAILFFIVVEPTWGSLYKQKNVFSVLFFISTRSVQY